MILHSQNGGVSWSQQSTGNVTATLYAIDFLDEWTGIAVGSGGTILRTENGGQTWLPVGTATAATLYGVCFHDATHAWAYGNSGTLLFSSDRGMS